jgi:hypothetical protein
LRRVPGQRAAHGMLLRRSKSDETPKMNQSKEVIFDGGNGNYAFTTSFCIKI